MSEITKIFYLEKLRLKKMDLSKIAHIHIHIHVVSLNNSITKQRGHPMRGTGGRVLPEQRADYLTSCLHCFSRLCTH